MQITVGRIGNPSYNYATMKMLPWVSHMASK
jgi:hypothetical protein